MVSGASSVRLEALAGKERELMSRPPEWLRASNWKISFAGLRPSERMAKSESYTVKSRENVGCNYVHHFPCFSFWNTYSNSLLFERSYHTPDRFLHV